MDTNSTDIFQNLNSLLKECKKLGRVSNQENLMVSVFVSRIEELNLKSTNPSSKTGISYEFFKDFTDAWDKFTNRAINGLNNEMAEIRKHVIERDLKEHSRYKTLIDIDNSIRSLTQKSIKEIADTSAKHLRFDVKSNERINQK